jgi:hypothetical protein
MRAARSIRRIRSCGVDLVEFGRRPVDWSAGASHAREGAGAAHGTTVQADRTPEEGSPCATREREATDGDRAELQRVK